MKKVLHVLTLLFITFSGIFGQPPTDRQDRGSMPMDGKITGKIVDSNNQFPIEYASIGLYSMRDSSLITGVLSDTAGNFTLANLPYGRFYADIKFLGYKKSRIKGILVIPNQKSVTLGVVKLEGNAAMLKQVEITGERPPLEYKLDRKVVNVGQQIAAAGGTAVDVLENTPSVQTDVEGNVTLRGSSNFTVLIDGKPTVLKGSEALQQLPASIIQQIEIITNPSAKFDPDGSAGIINVVMKKEKIKGINGVLNLSAGTGDKYTGDFLVNIRNSKFNYFIGGDFNDIQFKMKGLLDQRTTSFDTTNFQEGSTHGKMHRSGAGIKGGVDYSINDKNTLSLSGSVSQRSFNRFMQSQNNEYSDLSNLKDYFLQTNNSKSPHQAYSATLDYLLKLKGDGHELSATIYYSHSPESNTTDMWDQSTDSTGVLNHLADVLQQSKESGEENEYRAKADYTLPIGKGKFEAGYQGRYEETKGDYHFYNIQDTKVEDLSQYNKVKFTDHIESMYATYSNSMKLFEYMLGIRGEYTDRNIVKQITGQEYPINRFDFFPSVHLSKQLPWNMQVLASYSKRIDRPGDRELDPFPQRMDRNNIREGNPALKPQLGDSYELNFQKRIGEGFVSAEGFYKQTRDLFTQWFTSEGNITTQTYKNSDKDYSLGTEIMINMPLTKWWSVNASTSIYKYHLEKSTKDSSRSSNTSNSRFNTTFRFPWGMQMQANFFYNAPSITPQGTREGFYYTTIGLRQELLKKKASLTFQARDLFGNMKFATTSESAGFYRFNSMKRESPIFMLTFSYRINNFKQQASKHNTNDINSSNESDFNNGGGME